MLYDRPTGVHRPAARIAAGALVIAMLALGFLGSPPKVTAQTVEWRDATGLPALDGTNGTGRTAPVPLDVQLDGSFPVSVSLAPTLAWRDVPDAVGQVTFTITTLAEKSPKVLWSRTVAVGTDRVAKVGVPLGTIAQGRTYAWSAASSVNAAVNNDGPFPLTVDVQRSGSQPVFTAGNLAIAEGTGELVYSYQGPSMSTLSGPVGWTLVHRPTNTPQPGLPEGWRLVVSGSTGWDALRLNDDGSVTLSTSTGVSVTYVKRGQNLWEPQVGGFNTAGETTLLAQNTDGTFSATDGNRTVTVFSRPTANASGRPTRIWSLDTPTAQQTWSDGRLHGLVDPVTDNSIAILYGGEDGCTSTVDPGFVKAPDGMLCGSIDATGNVVMLEYVRVGDHVQIGRIVSGLGAGIYAASSDIGWDDSGRIVELRNPLAAAAVASDVVAGLGSQDARVLAQIAYDASGRVASLTAPAGLIAGKEQPAAREERAKTVFSYAPFTVRTAGVSTPAGFDARDWLDPVTLRVVKKIDESGNAMTYDYDGSGNVVKLTGLSTGSQTTTRYDRYGRPVEQLGPTKGALTSPTAPRTTTAYDQDAQGRDWTGLAVRYWSNAGFNGAPSSGTTGPVVGGGVVGDLQFNWPSSPAGGSGAWSARLTGVYEASAAGSYRFDTQTSAKLWVNGRLCAPSCSTTLAPAAAASLQIDVVSLDGAAAGVKVMVTGPDGRQVAVPTAQLRPNYGLATSSTVRESDGGGVRTLVTRMVYDPITTQLLQTISPSGATMSRTYEPYDPANGQWGRSTSVTDASGKTTTSTYYAKDAVATDCSGQAQDQSGALKSVTLPDGPVISQIVGPDGGALVGADGSSTSCTIGKSENLGFETSTSGLGSEVKSYSLPTVDGNPLVSAEATVAGGETKINAVAVDTNGNVWKTIDAQGTTTVRQWDAVRGHLDRVIETTRGGQTRSTEYTYAPSGQVATVTVNGRLLATNVYSADGALLRTELGNGSVQTFELDLNNNARKNVTRFPDGTTLTETMVRSPSGRLLSRTIAGPSGASTYSYDYNADGRLVDTKLTGTIPARETRWQNAYTGPDGRNGNRASETTTRADGTLSTATFAYGADNRLLSASGERFSGPLEYDAAGRATKIGGVGLTYDAAGHLLSAGDASRKYTFSDAGATTTLERTVDGQKSTL
ncbi:MAG: RHS repeat domain-containing protein, partial [Gaiellales bacterium]